MATSPLLTKARGHETIGDTYTVVLDYNVDSVGTRTYELRDQDIAGVQIWKIDWDGATATSVMTGSMQVDSLGVGVAASGAQGDQNWSDGTNVHLLDASTGELHIGSTGTGYLNIGDTSPGAAVTNGEIAAGDGTRTFLWSADTMLVDVFGDYSGFAGMKFRNTLNSSGAHSLFQFSVGGASAGDPYFLFTVTGATNWSVGVDNSSSDAFCIGQNNAPNFSLSALSIDTSNTTLNGNLTVSGGGVTHARTAANALHLIQCTTSGDPYINFRRVAAANWSIGMDDSDSDAFVLVNNSSLSGTNVIRVASGATTVEFPGAVDVGTGLTLGTGDVAAGSSGAYLWYDHSAHEAILVSDSGGASGPRLRLQLDSASPADNDRPGFIDFYSDDDGGTARLVNQIYAEFDDVTSSTMDSSMYFGTMNNSSANINTVASLSSTGVWTDASAAANKSYEDAVEMDCKWWGKESILSRLRRLPNATGVYRSSRLADDSPKLLTAPRHFGCTAEDWFAVMQSGHTPALHTT